MPRPTHDRVGAAARQGGGASRGRRRVRGPLRAVHERIPDAVIKLAWSKHGEIRRSRAASGALQRAIAATSAAIIVTDLRLEIGFVNPAAVASLSQPSIALLGTDLGDAFDRFERAEIVDHIATDESFRGRATRKYDGAPMQHVRVTGCAPRAAVWTMARTTDPTREQNT